MNYDYSSFIASHPSTYTIDEETGLLSFHATVSCYDIGIDEWFVPQGLVLYDMTRTSDREYLKGHEDNYRIRVGYESHVLQAGARHAGCEFYPAS